jgi:density-regulated protein
MHCFSPPDHEGRGHVLQDKPESKGQKGKPKKKAAKEIVISLATRQRKKAITSVEGLDLFGVKLADAAKVFGKTYACGSSVVNNPSQKDQIDIQGDVQEVIPELILKQYGASNMIEKSNIIMIIEKQRVSYDDY